MELVLQRSYQEKWTEGIFFIKDVLVSKSLELKWANNERNVSCIPEGVYPVAIIQHPKFGACIQVNNVPGRAGILIHAANDAQKELRGCIAPVFFSSGHGKGSYSRLALDYIIENLKLSGDQKHFIKIIKKS
ncbi:MAG: hypothetical protein IPL55_07565 [Saprospiraceae bacterium]|nr:hypothetical protein [Saprospiraceae bacterium]